MSEGGAAFRKPVTSPPTIFSIALLAGIGLALVAPVEIFGPVLPVWLRVALGAGLIALGIGVILRSIKDITAGDTTYDPYAASTALVTTGIYARSRNPGYLGLAVVVLGWAVLLATPWLVATGAAAVVATNALVIRLEEAKLAEAFGADYAAYCKHTRRWL